MVPWTIGNVAPNTVNTPEATKYWPMQIAFSLIHSGAAPATGRSAIEFPSPPTRTISEQAVRIRLLSTQEPRPSTGGIPTVSHTSLKPGPARWAASGVHRPALARAIWEQPV